MANTYKFKRETKNGSLIINDGTADGLKKALINAVSNPTSTTEITVVSFYPNNTFGIDLSTETVQIWDGTAYVTVTGAEAICTQLNATVLFKTVGGDTSTPVTPTLAQVLVVGNTTDGQVIKLNYNNSNFLYNNLDEVLISNQADKLRLQNLAAPASDLDAASKKYVDDSVISPNYNLIFELNTATPTGTLASKAAFEAFLIADNPSLFVKLFDLQGMVLKIEVYGLVKLTDNFLFVNTEVVSIFDHSGISEVSHYVCYNATALKRVEFHSLKVCGDGFLQGCSVLSTAYLPNLKVCGNDVLRNNPLLTTVNLQSLQSAGGGLLADSTSLLFIQLPSLVSCGGQFLSISAIVTGIFPSLITNGTPFLEACSSLQNLIVLRRTAEVAAIETANSITAYVLANGTGQTTTFTTGDATTATVNNGLITAIA